MMTPDQDYGRLTSNPERLPSTLYRVEPLQLNAVGDYVRVMTTGIASLGYTYPETVAERTGNYYKERLQNESWTLLVARNPGGEVVGGLEAQYDSKGEMGRVHWVCTDPEKQRSGVATALYSEYEGILERRNAQYMLAAIHDTNIPSRNFHAKFGFNMRDPIFPLGKQMKIYYKNIR